MIAFAISLASAGFATHLVRGAYPATMRRILGYVVGLLVGCLAGMALYRGVLGTYGLSLGSLIGAALGPFAAARVTRPYRPEY